MRELACLFTTVELFRKRLSRQLPTQHISMLLLVAAHSGITQAELSEILGMPQGTVSRNIKLLACYYESESRTGRVKGYGLLETRPLNTGAYPLGVYLTPKGEDLIYEIVEGMRAEPAGFRLAC